MTEDEFIVGTSEISQRYNVIVYSLYAPGGGRVGRSGWDLQLGLSGLSKVADETGGECYSLGTSQLVSFKPCMDRLQKLLSNQYYVVFDAVPGKGWLAARQSPNGASQFRDSGA